MAEASWHHDFKRFFLDYYNVMVRFAKTYLSQDDCQDVVQDAFIKLYAAWNSVPTEGQARSFLYITVRHLCVSRLRHQSLEEMFILREMDEADNTAGADEFFSEVTYQETLRLLRRSIEELPPQSRRIMQLALKGNGNAEIAETLGISVNTVKTLKKSAYRSLRDSLGDVSDELFFLLLLGTVV